MTAPSRLLVVSPVVTHPATQGNSARIQALGQQLLSRGIAAELLYYGMEGLTAWQEAGMSAFWSRFHFVKSTPLPPPSLGSSWGVDSTLLCESICSERPDVVLLKSMDYDLSEFLIRRLDLSHTKIGFIVGGINVHPVLQHADFVLTESQRQSREVREFLNRPVPVEPLSKYVNWELADQLYANSTDPKRFDIVNVGDQIYELRDGSGVGVFAPQFGQRRSFYGGVTYSF